MSKMTKPTVGVVRFTESDVIVASGIMRVTGLGDGTPRTGTFAFGKRNYTASDIYGDGDYNPTFFSEFNAYFGTDYTDADPIMVRGESLKVLVSNEMDDTSASSQDWYNGTYRWNGTYFDRISQ